MRRLVPDTLDHVDEAAEYAVPEGVPWLRANMVSSLDGVATDADGRSAGISTPADRRLFKVLRSGADAIVVGARTAITERYHRAAVPVVLLTRTLALDLSTPVLADPPPPTQAPTIVVAPAGAPASRLAELRAHANRVEGIEVLLVPGVGLDLTTALELLRARGLNHLLCEGGPSVLAALVAEGLVDELCLTTSPLMAGGAGGRILAGAELPGPQPWRLAGLCEEDDTLFARWQRV